MQLRSTFSQLLQDIVTDFPAKKKRAYMKKVFSRKFTNKQVKHREPSPHASPSPDGKSKIRRGNSENSDTSDHGNKERSRSSPKSKKGDVHGEIPRVSKPNFTRIEYPPGFRFSPRARNCWKARIPAPGQLAQEHEISLCLVGDKEVGKTLLITTFFSNPHKREYTGSVLFKTNCKYSFVERNNFFFLTFSFHSPCLWKRC